MWWLIKVAPDEKTCLLCGEVTHLDYCERCSKEDGGELVRELVPTLNYLHEGEYQLNQQRKFGVI